MPDFGKYSLEGDLGTRAGFSVHRARLAGTTGPPAFAIKVASPDLLPAGDTAHWPRADARRPALLGDAQATIEVQVAAARSVPNGVVPVLDRGLDESAVWYAAPYYAWSFARLLTGKVRLTEEALGHVLRSIVRTARAMRQACGRSHGNLKPSNVFLDGRAERVTLTTPVRLADPAPGGTGDAERLELDDLRSVGRLLYQLVARDSVDTEDQWRRVVWPLTEDAEWRSRFGPRTGAWLKLCNDLLDPNLTPSSLDLARLEQRLAALEPKRKPWGKILLVVLGVGVVGSALGFAWWVRTNRGLLSASSDPPGAEVYERGVRLLTTGTGEPGSSVAGANAPVRLTVGEHDLEVRFGDLEPLRRTVAIERGRTSVVQFAFAYGGITLECTNPAGASITETHYGLVATQRLVARLLPPGRTLLLAVRHPEFLEENLSLVARAGTQQVHRLSLQKRVLGAAVLEITAPAGENDVVVYDRDWTELRSTKLRLQRLEGTYGFRALPPGWPRAAAQDFEVVVRREHQDRTIPVTTPRFPHGSIALAVQPPGAEVTAIGSYGTNMVGTVGSEGLEAIWPPGTYDLLVSLRGHETNVLRSVVLTDGGRFGTNLTLAPLGATVLITADLEGARAHVIELPEVPPRTVGSNGLALVLPMGTNRQRAYTLVAEYDRLGWLEPKTNALTAERTSNYVWEVVFDHGTAILTTEPDTAEVRLTNAVLAGRPLVRVQLPGVPYRYAVGAPHYEPRELEVTLPLAMTQRTNVVLARTAERVVIQTDPPEAVLVDRDGRPLRRDPSTADAYLLPWGTHLVVATHPHLDPATNPAVVVRYDAVESHRVQLAHGFLEVSTVPAGADVRLEGRPAAGVRTPARVPLPPGSSRVELSYGGRPRTNFVVDVAAGQTVVRTNLWLQPPVFTNRAGLVMVLVPDRQVYVSRTEVTNEQYRNVMGAAVPGDPALPVTMVSWDAARKFFEQLNGSRAEQAVLEQNVLDGWVYAVPTEAEWKGVAPTSPADAANAVLLSLQPKPVGQSRSALGLFDLVGNVKEWCLGADGSPRTIGGGFMDPNLRLPPAADTAKRQELNGQANDIGLRCLLRASSTR